MNTAQTKKDIEALRDKACGFCEIADEDCTALLCIEYANAIDQLADAIEHGMWFQASHLFAKMDTDCAEWVVELVSEDCLALLKSCSQAQENRR